MPANRKNPSVQHTARQSRDREGALADSVAGMRSLTVAARIGASQPPTFMSRAPLVCPTVVCHDGGPLRFLAGVRRRPIASRIAPASSVEDGFGDRCERKHLGGGVERYRFAGHAVDHAGRPDAIML